MKMGKEADMPKLDERGFFYTKKIPDSNLEVGVIPITFGRGRVLVGTQIDMFYQDVWWYSSVEAAVIAAREWNPLQQKEPQGWLRHPTTGRRRPDGDAAKENIAP